MFVLAHFSDVDKRLQHVRLLIVVVVEIVAEYVAHVDAVANDFRLDCNAGHVSVKQRANYGDVGHVGVLIKRL